jgi:hypothetical protein
VPYLLTIIGKPKPRCHSLRLHFLEINIPTRTGILIRERERPARKRVKGVKGIKRINSQACTGILL